MKVKLNRENIMDLTQLNSQILDKNEKTDKEHMTLWPQSNDSLNMTFSNVKSTCFPPISSKNGVRPK